ncbi:MAG: hypothetical protein QG624_538 [Pseudomonadota bacterium]|jgi:hypothetical protein|nr:hypothetical protein [Pseudomonadota bacterium]
MVFNNYFTSIKTKSKVKPKKTNHLFEKLSVLTTNIFQL